MNIRRMTGGDTVKKYSREGKRSYAQDLEISGDLEKEFRQQPSVFAYWSDMYALACDEEARANDVLDLKFSQLYSHFMKRNSGAKENQAKSFIRQHSQYKEAQEELRKAELAAKTLRGAVEGFRHRKDMLQQLGPLYRAGESQYSIGSPASQENRRQSTTTDNRSRSKTDKAAQIIRSSYQRRKEDG